MERKTRSEDHLGGGEPAPTRVRVRLNVVPGTPPAGAQLAKLARPRQAGVLSDMARLEGPLLKYLAENREALARFVGDPIAVLRSAAPEEGDLIDRIAAARTPADGGAPSVPDVELTSVEVTLAKRPPDSDRGRWGGE